MVRVAPAAAARRVSRRAPWRESAANSTSRRRLRVAAGEVSVQQRLEMQRGGGDARAFLDLERELARRDLIGAESDREDARRPVDVRGELLELRPQSQRAVDRRAGSALAACQGARHGGAGEDRARVRDRVAPRAVDERRHQRVIGAGRERRVVRAPMVAVTAPAPRAASSARIVARVVPSCEMPMQMPPGRGSSAASSAWRASGRERAALPPSASVEQRRDGQRAVLGGAAARHDDRLAGLGGPGDGGRERLAPGQRCLEDRAGEPALSQDHLLHHPRRPVAQLGEAGAVPAAVVAAHARTGGCSAVATPTRFQALMAMITPIRLPSSSSPKAAAAAS